MAADAYQQLWAMIKSCALGTLITQEENNGCLRAWPMASCQQEFDGNLWFFVTNDSPAVACVEANPEVCLVYSHCGETDVVSVCGPALVVTNIAHKQRLWNPIVQASFPQGPTSGSIVLIRVSVHHAEYWDPRINKLVRLTNKAKSAYVPEQLNAAIRPRQHELTM